MIEKIDIKTSECFIYSCCICSRAVECFKGNYDSKFDMASPDQIISRLDNRQFLSSKKYMISILKNYYGIEYKEKISKQELENKVKEIIQKFLQEILFIEADKNWQENEQLVEFSNKIVDKIEEFAKQFDIEIQE